MFPTGLDVNEGSQKSILMTPEDEKGMSEAKLPWETYIGITQRRLTFLLVASEEERKGL